MPRMPSVPLISARPSLAVSVSGSMRRGGQRLGGRDALAARRQHLALADQREAAVGQRGEVAAGPERAVLGHHRVEPRRQQRQHRVGHHRPRSGAAHGQGAGAQEDHRAHHLPLHRRPHAGGVRADQRALQLLAALRRDPGAGERAEAGRDPVDRLVGAASRSTTAALSAMAARASSDSRACAPWRATATTSSRSTRSPVSSIVAVGITAIRSHAASVRSHHAGGWIFSSRRSEQSSPP